MLNKEERNINHNKTTRRAGYKKVYEPPLHPTPTPRKHSELKEPYEMLN